MATEVHYTAEEAEWTFLAVGNELPFIMVRLHHLLHVVRNRFGTSHKLFRMMWALYDKMDQDWLYTDMRKRSLGDALHDVICKHYPPSVESIGGVEITKVFRRYVNEASPFALTPSEGRRKSKHLLPEERKYLLDTVNYADATLMEILNNETLFDVRCYKLAKKQLERITEIIRYVGESEDE